MADKTVSLQVIVDVQGANTVEELEEGIKKLQDELNKTAKGSKENKELNKALTDTKKRLDAVKKSAKDTGKTIEKVGDSAEVAKDGIDDASKSMKDFATGTEEAKGEISDIADKMSGGLVGSIKDSFASLKKLIGGMSLLKKAIAATGIGLLVIGIVSLIQAFKRSEDGQNKFAKLMAVIGSVVGNVLDALANIGETMIGIFSGESEAIKKAKAFGKKFFDVVGLPIKIVTDIVGGLVGSIVNLLDGEVEAAFDSIVNIGSNVTASFEEAKVAIDEASESVVGFVKELKEEAKEVKKIADARAKADKQERALIVERAKANQKIAALRRDFEKRDQFTLDERIAKLQEAVDIEDAITAKEISTARLRLNAMVAESNQGKSTKEDLREIAELRASVIELDTARIDLQASLVAQIQSLKEEEKAQAAAQQAIVDERLRKEKEAADKLKETAQGLADEIELIGLSQFDKDRIKAARKFEALTKDLTDEHEITKNAKILLEEELRQIEADEQTKKDDAAKEAQEKELARVKEVAEAKLQIQDALLSNTSDLLKEAFDEQTAAGKVAFNAAKALDVARAVINTYAAANAALKTGSEINPTYGIVSAGAAVLAGLANVKKILSTKIGGSVPGGSSPNVQANIQQQPIQTGLTRIPNTQRVQVDPLKVFVLESDITNAQTTASDIQKVSVVK